MQKLVMYLFPIGLVLIAMNGLGPTANVIGYVMVLGSLYLTLSKKIQNWGPWWMWVGFGLMLPLALISNVGMRAVMLISVAPFVYLAGLNTNKDILSKVFGITSLVASLSVFVYLLAGHTQGNGGIVDTTNYNLAAGVVIIGALLAPKNWRWLLITLAVPSMVLAGAEEGLFAIAVIGLYSILRLDIGAKMIPIVVISVLAGIALFVFHQPESIYGRVAPQIADPGSSYAITNGRWDIYIDSLKDFRFFGHGYNPITMAYNSIHDIPLMILYQLGVIGLAGWIILMFGTLLKSKEKYLIVGVLALSAFDHFLFTQLWLWTPAVLGIAHQSGQNDKIWRNV